MTLLIDLADQLAPVVQPPRPAHVHGDSVGGPGVVGFGAARGDLGGPRASRRSRCGSRSPEARRWPVTLAIVTALVPIVVRVPHAAGAAARRLSAASRPGVADDRGGLPPDGATAPAPRGSAVP